MKRICVIPARGGSKRIPRKNIKMFLGKPILSYSIEAALKSNLFDKVFVSTDDIEIAEIAKKYGASVPFLRSENASNDVATTFDVVKEVIEEFENRGENYSAICCIYACAPFVTNEKIKEALNLMIKEGYDSVFPVMKYGFPIQRSMRIEKGKLSFAFPDNSLKRSQDFEDSYHDAGQFYWMKTKKIMADKAIVTSNSGGIVISELEGQDIDNEIDWKLAELKYKLLNE